ncbi:MAG: hypothetical protein P8Y58_12715 [Novosphingobium sp.]
MICLAAMPFISCTAFVQTTADQSEAIGRAGHRYYRTKALRTYSGRFDLGHAVTSDSLAQKGIADVTNLSA